MTPKTFLTERKLAERWDMSERTLQRWRWDWPRKKQGPEWVKIGTAIRYDLDVIEEYEVRHTGDTVFDKAE